MKILSQCSFIASFVLVTSLFNSVDAAKVVPNGISINLSQRVIARVSGASFLVKTEKGETELKNVLFTLLEFYQKNPAVIELLINFYNSIKSGTVKDTVVPEALLNKMTPEIVNIVCVKDGQVFKIKPEIFSTLDLLMESIKDGIDAAKAKTCKACCQIFWCKTTPKFLLMTADLIMPTLIAIASSATTKSVASENFIITIPCSLINYEAVRVD